MNPTISTDQLGAFMRELFAEEMTAQRELHDRVAKAHLEDFQDQLTSQTSTTISFAFASLSLSETPPLGKKAALPPPRPGAKLPEPPVPRAPTVPTEILPQAPIASGIADRGDPDDRAVARLHAERVPRTRSATAAAVPSPACSRTGRGTRSAWTP